MPLKGLLGRLQRILCNVKLFSINIVQPSVKSMTQMLVKTKLALGLAGNALAWVQRVHEPIDLWDITFCTCRF